MLSKAKPEETYFPPLLCYLLITEADVRQAPSAYQVPGFGLPRAQEPMEMEYRGSGGQRLPFAFGFAHGWFHCKINYTEIEKFKGN